jgi:hypothetical protein
MTGGPKATRGRKRTEALAREEAYRKALGGGDAFEPSLKGEKCPHCKRYMKIYQRPITYTAAVALLYLYRLAKRTGQTEYVYLEQWLKKVWPNHKRGDETKMRHWGLIERMPSDRAETDHRNGMWRITELGFRFVEGAAIPRFVYTYNDVVLGRSDGSVARWGEEYATIKDALKTIFDYTRLMADDWAPPEQLNLKGTK